jgi:N4-(beta-N-acetylglucosaminyl)-L-asparaginase
MVNQMTRREFVRSTAIGSMAVTTVGPAAADEEEPPTRNGPGGPVVIASANGLQATAKAMDLITGGTDTLDAVIAGVNIIEGDPDDHTVGLGGLPNEDGVVELDASVMHGPTHNAGAVAALRNIKYASRVAKLVMERTDHVLLVGDGALRFARAHGFEEENLLTDEARRLWLKWKENLSPDDDWLPPPDAPEAGASTNAAAEILFTYGTIHCNALDAAGNLSGVTTTSGLSYKIPGRVGDSPLIGAGLYVDNAVGAAGATGRGEAVIKTCGAFAVVEMMRLGRTPQEACLAGLRRIVEHNGEPRLRRKDGRPNFDVKLYALSKNGTYGAASLWSGAKFAVYSRGGNRLENCAYLFERPPDER